MGADPIDGLGIFDADVVDDGKDDAECCDAEQDNPIQGFEIDESVLIKLLNEFFHVGQYTKKNPLVAGPFVNVLRNFELFRHALFYRGWMINAVFCEP